MIILNIEAIYTIACYKQYTLHYLNNKQTDRANIEIATKIHKKMHEAIFARCVFSPGYAMKLFLGAPFGIRQKFYGKSSNFFAN